MINSCNRCRNNCTTVAVVVSVILGVITAFLRITAVITLTPAFLWVVLGVAVVYLFGTLVSSILVKGQGGIGGCCDCTTLFVLLLSIIGAVILSVVLLAITFAATSVVGAILTGLLVLFFFQIITVTACYVLCLNRCE